MRTERLTAFTDGVVAIIITIMVLELKAPQGADLHALAAEAPILAAYVLSYVNVGVFWANHHHLLMTAEKVDGRALWANLFLLFWLSLVPFVIRWVDATDFVGAPLAAYGFVLAMAGIGYGWLQRTMIAANGGTASRLAGMVGSDRKGKLSVAGYAIAMPLAFVAPTIAILIYVAIAGVWAIPDRRIERGLSDD